MAMQLLPFIQVCTSLKQRRECEVIRGQASFDDFTIEEDGLSRQVPIGIASDYGVVDEFGRVGNLVEHNAGITEASGVFKGTESNYSACGIGIGEEACADHVGMDLLELRHGVAVLNLGERWVGFYWAVFAGVGSFGEGFSEGWWWDDRVVG